MFVNGRKNNKKRKIVKVKMNFSWKNVLLYGFLFIFIMFFFIGVSGQSLNETKNVPLSQVISDVKQRKVSEIVVVENKLTVEKNGETIVAFKEQG